LGENNSPATDFKELVLDKLVERLNLSVFFFTFVRWLLCVFVQRMATGVSGDGPFAILNWCEESETFILLPDRLPC